MRRKFLCTLPLLLLLGAPPLRAEQQDMKTTTLLASEEDFRHRWIKGNGTVAYDAKSRNVHVYADVGEGEAIGGFAYDATWSEVAFATQIDPMRGGYSIHLIVVINGEKIDLASAIRKPGTFTFRAVLAPDKTVGLFVNDKLAGKATLKTADKLAFTFESRSIAGGTMHFSQIKVQGAAEAEHAAALPDQKNPGGMKPVTLLQAADDLPKHFKKGQGTAEFDPKSKTVVFEKTDAWDIGSILYQAPWEEIQFDIAINKQPKLLDPRFLVSFGSTGVMNNAGECFDLSSRITGPGRYRIRAAYVKNKTLAVFVNDKPVGPVATILKDSRVTPLKLRIFTTYKGVFRLGNVRIKALPEE